MEKYRSGHNENDSKFLKLVSVLSARNPVFMRGYAVRKTEYFVVLSVSSFQKFWKRFSDWHMESCPSGRRCSTRNAVDREVSRVRIPNSPPSSSQAMYRLWRFFYKKSSRTHAAVPPLPKKSCDFLGTPLFSKQAGLLDFSFLSISENHLEIMERTDTFSERTKRIFDFPLIRADKISFLRHRP